MKRASFGWLAVLAGLSLCACIVRPEPMVQTRYVASPQPQPQPVVVSSAPSSTLCYEGCRWSGDGECDDGRPGANTRLCAYGSDCSDCGPGIVASGGVYVAPESAGVGVSVY